MSATTINRPAVARGTGALTRPFAACLEGIARYFGRRDAIAWLRELDDRALRDIGIARCHIEAAANGFMTAFEPVEAIVAVSSTALLTNAARGAGNGRRVPEQEPSTWS
jgi:uncharacterized protein YjiS (DUF1127 family)